MASDRTGKMPSTFGVLLLNMGGPRNLEEIEPYLNRLFNDSFIFQMPLGRFYQKKLARFLASKRAVKAAKRYKAIGGKSPLHDNTVKLASRLEEMISAPVRFAMRYTEPGVQKAVKTLSAKGADHLIVIPLYPQYSIVTSGSSLHEFKERNSNGLACDIVKSHHDHPGYRAAIAELLQAELDKIDDKNTSHILFAAHSIPLKYVRRGDPYVDQVRETVSLAYEKTGTDVPHSLAFQSRIGPVKWQGPSLEEEFIRLKERGVKHIVVHPAAFVSENLETLYDLDIEFRNRCEGSGIRYCRTATVDSNDTYLRALRDIIMEVRKGTEGDV